MEVQVGEEVERWREIVEVKVGGRGKVKGDGDSGNWIGGGGVVEVKVSGGGKVERAP